MAERQRRVPSTLRHPELHRRVLWDTRPAHGFENPRLQAKRQTGFPLRDHSRDLRPTVAAGALVTAGVAAAAVLLVAQGPRTPTAFARVDVNADPRPGASDDRRRGRLPAAAGGGATALGAVTIKPALTDTAGMSPVLADTRGPSTFVIFAGQRFGATCITGPGFASATYSVSPAPAVPLASDSSSHSIGIATGAPGRGLTP
jgi:hypothetical protein